jgi:hypothetical protein
MREWIAYLGEVILITAVSGMIYHLAPEGALKKHLHFVISLCVLISLAIPMLSIVSELPVIFEKTYEDVEMSEDHTENNLLGTVISASKKEIETAVISYIAGKYDIPPQNITVTLTLDESNPQAIEITAMEVTIASLNGAKAGKIQSDLSEMFLGKTEVTVH